MKDCLQSCSTWSRTSELKLVPKSSTLKKPAPSGSSDQVNPDSKNPNPYPFLIEIGPPNIIVFGQSGSGKSSLINMLARKDVATVSGNSIGCTPSAQAYDISPDSDNRIYRFWDTPGLNEGDEGNVPARDAIDELRRVIEGHRLPTINLAIYCVRGQDYAQCYSLWRSGLRQELDCEHGPRQGCRPSVQQSFVMHFPKQGL
jgi:hypothetical protein